MEKRKRQIEKLTNLLQFNRQIVGVRFIYDKEDFEACPAQRILYSLPYCMMVKAATAGHNIKATAENIGCFAAARVLGMTEVTESYKSGEDYMGFGMFDNQKVSKKVCDNISINERTPYGVELGPYAEMEKNPDVVIIVTVPYNAMRLIQGYNYYNGTYNNYKMGGLQAMCAEITAYTYVSQNINTSMMCAGTRFLAKWGRDEMAVGLPFSKFDETVEGVFHTADPLERDGDKQRILDRFSESDQEAPSLHMGQNYDTNYYKVGKSGII